MHRSLAWRASAINLWRSRIFAAWRWFPSVLSLICSACCWWLITRSITSRRWKSQLYRIIKDLGGAALARIQLVQDAEARVERERWLREFGERVMRMPDLDTMMVQAAESLQDVVQADGVVVSIALPESAQIQPDR